MMSILKDEDMSFIKKVEELSLNAHPSLNTFYHEGWIIRMADGYTSRANSVYIPNGNRCGMVADESIVPYLLEKINYCEKIYASQGLGTTFKITPLQTELDAQLAKKGYKVVTPTNIMRLGIATVNYHTSEVITKENIDFEWENSYYRLSKLKTSYMETASRIHQKIINKCICATGYLDGEIVACGLCVVEDDYAGLYNIVVSEQHRRKGYGYRICMSLLTKATELGAETAYLQVVAENEGAKQLYRKMGFEDCYQYWYRVKTL